MSRKIHPQTMECSYIFERKKKNQMIYAPSSTVSNFGRPHGFRTNSFLPAVFETVFSTHNERKTKNIARSCSIWQIDIETKGNDKISHRNNISVRPNSTGVWFLFCTKNVIFQSNSK